MLLASPSMIVILLTMWCSWSDWSVHSADRCAPTRAACEQILKKKKKKGECSSWLT